MHKLLTGVLIVCLVLVSVNPTASGDTLSKEEKETLIGGLLERGYKKDEIPGMLDLAGLAGGPSVSREVRDVCLEILNAPVTTTKKTDKTQQEQTVSEERRKQLETAAKFGVTEEELDNLTAFLGKFGQLETHKQEELARRLFTKDYPYNLSPALIDKDGDGKNFIKDWGRMNLKEKRQQAIYNLIRANKAVTKESVDTMVNSLDYLAALR